MIRPRESYKGKQALTYIAGIAAENTGCQGIFMHLLNLLSKERFRADLHEDHETAIYLISGKARMWYGESLKKHVDIDNGDFPQHPRRRS